MLYLVIKAAISGVIVAAVSEIARRYPGWGGLLASLPLTSLLAMLDRRRARDTTGPAAAFLLLGAWLSCFHFMYYDVLLAALPLFLLFTEPARYLRPAYVLWRALPAGWLPAATRGYYQARFASGRPPALPDLAVDYRHLWVQNRMIPTLAAALYVTQPLFPSVGLGGFFGPPWETFWLMAVWLWCGWLWLSGKEEG